MTRIRRNVRSMPMIYVRELDSGEVCSARIRSWCTVSKGRGKGKRISYSVVVNKPNHTFWVEVGTSKKFRFVYTRDLIRFFNLSKTLMEVQLD